MIPLLLPAFECHDPHVDGHCDDEGFYDRQYLTCHGAGAVLCNVNALSGDCIGCSIPSVNQTPHLSFSDHWIRKR
jgi:hypothetical protein